MKVFLDSADPEEIAAHANQVDGFTTNPTLMRQAGVTDYLGYCKALVSATDLPVSLEVLADDWKSIERQACVLSDLGENVYVKVPVSLTSGASADLTLVRLANRGMSLNVTCVTSHAQVRKTIQAIAHGGPSIISIFAGRVADAGVDPTHLVKKAVKEVACRAEILWASTREAYNALQAQASGADIITVTPALLPKVTRLLDGSPLPGLGEVSLAAVRQFVADGAGYQL